MAPSLQLSYIFFVNKSSIEKPAVELYFLSNVNKSRIENKPEVNSPW
jgi:hypothetical protein